VLLNLIMNAMEAAMGVSQVHRRVSISATVVPESACCAVCVRDTGPGIAPDQLHRIFEPFFTSKSEGLGIGLSISRAIIEAHGGKLWAENETRGGASFHFTVPVDESNLPLSA
jgi:signal transduction histidine kinase